MSTAESLNVREEVISSNMFFFQSHMKDLETVELDVENFGRQKKQSLEDRREQVVMQVRAVVTESELLIRQRFSALEGELNALRCSLDASSQALSDKHKWLLFETDALETLRWLTSLEQFLKSENCGHDLEHCLMLGVLLF